MKRFAVIGFPLGHSLSPIIHNAALQELGLDAMYEALPTETEQLGEVVQSLREGELSGLNVTVPHKEAVIELIEGLDGGAKAIGAVNCIVADGTGLIGHNTDKVGFIESLGRAGLDPHGKSALVLGAGGSARAVALGLLESGARSVTIAGRNRARTEQLAEQLAGHLKIARPGAGEIGTREWDEGAIRVVASAVDLIVNCTPVGMSGGAAALESPLPPGCIREGQWVSDLVYNPAVTPLLAQAQAGGALALGGLDMLVLQAAESLRLWTGQNPPVGVMREAAQKALAG